jgi:uncharacterized membrane protein
MARISLRTRVLTLVVILTSLFGNFFMKWGLDRRPGRLGATVLSYLGVLFDPWVALGVCLLILWLLTRMMLLSWADLSYVVPVTSIGYALNAVVARVFLGERMTAGRWAGTLLIMAGTALVGSTAERTEEEAMATGGRR